MYLINIKIILNIINCSGYTESVVNFGSIILEDPESLQNMFNY